MRQADVCVEKDALVFGDVVLLEYALHDYRWILVQLVTRKIGIHKNNAEFLKLSTGDFKNSFETISKDPSLISLKLNSTPETYYS